MVKVVEDEKGVLPERERDSASLGMKLGIVRLGRAGGKVRRTQRLLRKRTKSAMPSGGNKGCENLCFYSD